MTFPIRDARLRDLVDILAMIRALSAFHGDEAQISLSGLQELFFDGGPARALLAHDGDMLVGYAGLMPHVRLHSGYRTLDVQHLFVVETHRGRGVGRALITAIRDRGMTEGYDRLTIGADPQNAGAQAAYAAMGWTPMTGTHPRYVWPLGGS